MSALQFTVNDDASTNTTLQPDMGESQRLLDSGLMLVKLHPFTKQPIGLNWNKHPAKSIDQNATGYGLPLAANGLCSIDPDQMDMAKAGLKSWGFDLDELLAAGVRTSSTRPGSGGRSAFAADDMEMTRWLTFNVFDDAGIGITVLELRAKSENLQDCVPGVVYKDKTTGKLCTQQYANENRFDNAPELPDSFTRLWRYLSTDDDALREYHLKFCEAVAAAGFKVNGKKAQHRPQMGSGKKLAFPSSFRGPYNRANKVEQVIEPHGYKWHTREQRYSHSGATGAPGIRLIPSKDELWQSDHAGDPLHGTFDAFGAYVQLDHNGDLAAAEKALQKAAEDEVKRDFAHSASDPLFTPPARGYVQLPESFTQTELGKLAARIARCIEFPQASTALALLAGASAAVATSYAVQYQSGTPVPAGIYGVIEQPPSMMKSRLLSFAQMPYLKAMGEHNRKIYEHCAGLGKDDYKPSKGFDVTTDPTTAGLDMTLAGCSEGRFVIASAEQAAFQSLFPDKGDFASHNGLLLQGWAGEYASATRKGRAAFSGYASGTVLVIAQPGSSARVFSASNGTGLAERFFYLSEPSPLGTRKHHGQFVTRDELAPFNKACRECVNDYSRRRFDLLEQVQDPDQLRQLTFTPEGYQLMLETRRRIEPTLGKLAKDGELVQVGWLGKIETHTMKVAAVLHVIECLANDCKPSAQIPLKVVQIALEFVEMLGGHLAGLLHDSGETGEAAEVDAVLDLLTRKPYKIRPLAQTLRKRHPFRSMGPEAYQRARARIEAMHSEGRLIANIKGELEPC
ncbi:MAG: DUF3987 domain-containing protein [Pseudohongiellaceae bacterium]